MVIPARYGSRRLPGKVLANETGKYLVQHVWEAVVGCPGVSRVIIATDSEVVCEAARSFGADCEMTSAAHVSGTDRVAEVARDLSEELIINIQADEPHISHSDIKELIDLFDTDGECFAGGRVDMTTLVVRRTDPEGFHDPNIVKAVFGQDGRALYFSRSPAPYPAVEENSGSGESSGTEWWHHLGVYGYLKDFLRRFSAMEPTPLEQRERLEQLRALGNGAVIRVGLAAGRRGHGTQMGIDTPEEYRNFVEEYRRSGESPGQPVKDASSGRQVV